MFGIGSVARIAQVSVRTLRYYDEIGLMSPRWIDPVTGYRWYSADQLHRLHRILALRDLGVSLRDITGLVDSEISAEGLRGILLLRRAEAQDRLVMEAERLARVEARLKQLEEDVMSDYDIVVKAVEPTWVLATTEEVANVEAVGPAHGRLWPRLDEKLRSLGIWRVPPSIARELGDGPIQFTAGVSVAGEFVYGEEGFETMAMPGLERVAATVIRGDPNFHEANEVLLAWIEEAGEKVTGEYREVYLDCDGPRDTWVVEIQRALQPRT